MLSTATTAPAACARLEMAAMSTICKSGFVGVSIQTSLVAGVIMRANPAGLGSSVKRLTRPQGLKTRSSKRNVPPYMSAAAATSSPGFNVDRTAVLAARPDANASPLSPASRAARQVSRAVRVGFPEREYS